MKKSVSPCQPYPIWVALDSEGSAFMAKKRFRSLRARLLVLGIAAGLGPLAACAATSAAPSGPKSVESPEARPLFGGDPVTLSDCAKTDFSVLSKGEVNTGFDSESGILELSALGPDAVDVFFWVSVDDPICQAVPELAKQIASAVSAASETTDAD